MTTTNQTEIVKKADEIIKGIVALCKSMGFEDEKIAVSLPRSTYNDFIKILSRGVRVQSETPDEHEKNVVMARIISERAENWDVPNNCHKES